jgi:CRP-like cAMP-binding protein
MALLGQGMQDSFAEAMEKSVLYTLNKRDVQDVLLSDPRVSRRLLELVSHRLEDTEKKLAEFAFKNVPQRLASLLLQLAHGAPRANDGGVSLPVRYTHQQLAEMIGTYRETVTKVLNDFRQQGWIRIDHGRILLVDVVALEGMIAS